jgi:stage V sporulation protein B
MSQDVCEPKTLSRVPIAQPEVLCPTKTSPCVVRNSAMNLAGQGIYAVLYVVIIAALARGLGKESFGTYYALFATMLIVQVVCEAGLSTVLTRRLAQSPGARRSIIAEATWLFGGVVLVSVGMFLALGALWCWWHDNGDMLFSFAMAGVACGAVQVQRGCAAVFGAYERFEFENAARLIQGATLLVPLLILAWQQTMNLEQVLVLLALSHIAASSFLLWRLRSLMTKKEAALTTAPRQPRWWWHWLAESVPLGFGDVLRGLCWQVDTVLLSLLQPAAVMGIYSIAYRPLGPINWLPLCILTALFPSFARTAGVDRDALQKSFATSVRILWIASLPIAVFFCMCAEPIILLLAGPEYLEAAEPLRVIIWLASLTFVSYPFRYVLTSLGHARTYTVLVLVVLVIQISLDLILIPALSYWGACISSMVAESIFVLGGFVICQRLSLSGIPWRAVPLALLAAMGMSLLLLPASMMVNAGSALGFLVLTFLVMASSLVYLALCVFLGAVQPSEATRFAAALGWNR